ncbi:haloacid dehalogenase type II [Rhizobium leucaenae]|uniref:(S)-2-haloacid dehalogenase n=1 Tax=Rhizobium leucaenae TaxID=29450 RepID=A0A7W7EME0_9HYPH|nr:haloacid dehalogenase type II [Rhizobium leucaenae]MBB4570991.1 2-haloacid dehalogenase [Rhizobium leucaenae]
MPDFKDVKLLGFDVFGTVVDWRGSVARHVDKVFSSQGIVLDPYKFASDWRSLYQPAMERVRTGERSWVPLDVLNLENLKVTLAYSGVDATRFTAQGLNDLNKAWERLAPWPDSVAAIDRLKRKFAVGTISNGHVAGMLWLSKFAELHWDVILGAETAKNYKPRPEVYFRSAESAGLSIEETAMVAAHNDDLEAARGCGMKTVFVRRPTEHGPDQTTDLVADDECDIAVKDLAELADVLEC